MPDQRDRARRLRCTLVFLPSAGLALGGEGMPQRRPSGPGAGTRQNSLFRDGDHIPRARPEPSIAPGGVDSLVADREDQMGFRQFRPVKLTFNTPTSTPALAREEAPIVPKKVVGTEGNDGIGLADSLRPAEVHGGMGKDTIIGTAFSDTLYGDWGDDTIFAGRGDDKVYGGQGEDSLFGGEGNDTLFGGDDGDEINGGAGNDTLFGEQGGDHLLGGEGNDWLFGGQGNDVLTGGKGTDWLWGGEGKDSFRFHLAHDGIIPLDGQKGGALDQIMDFSVGDRIELWIDRRILGDSFDNCWGHVQIQSGADLSDARRGLVFDETTDTLYFDAGSTGFAIAQVHGSVPPTISSIDVVFL